MTKTENTVTQNRELALKNVKSILYDDEIPNTFSVMCQLRNYLGQLAAAEAKLAKDDELITELLQCSSLAICGGLHHRELGITNAVIKSKNRLLELAEVEVPESHKELKPEDFNYRW